MEKLARLNDRGEHNGKIITASSNYTCRGAKVALDGDIYECATHGRQRLIGSSHFTENGKSVIRVGDKAACGAKILEGAEGTSFN